MKAHGSIHFLVAVLATLIALSAAASVASDGAEADSVNLNGITDSGFVENKTGTIYIPVSSDIDQDLKITVKYEGTVIAERIIAVTADTTKADVSFSMGKGTHNLDITADLTGSHLVNNGQYELFVKEDIWANIGTYLALAVVAVVAVIIAVVYMRAKPNNKPKTTFTQLENEKKDFAKSAESSTPSKTDRIKYTSSRRK